MYRFPAETIKIDTSGRAFDRMSSTRKSLVCYTTTRQKKEGDAAKPEEDTVRRRSRIRRPRGKRRNTIASSDQREIAEVINKGYVNGVRRGQYRTQSSLFDRCIIVIIVHIMVLHWTRAALVPLYSFCALFVCVCGV